MQSFTSMTVCSTCISWSEGKAHLQADSHIGQTKCTSLIYVQHKQVHYTALTTLDLKYIHVTCLDHSRAAVGSREESFFAHAPHSILTQFQDIYWSTTTSGSTWFTLFVARTIFDYVRTLQITSINKCRLLHRSDVTSDIVWRLPLSSMQNMLPFT